LTGTAAYMLSFSMYKNKTMELSETIEFDRHLVQIDEDFTKSNSAHSKADTATNASGHESTQNASNKRIKLDVKSLFTQSRKNIR
jgi:hypothetical protein